MPRALPAVAAAVALPVALLAAPRFASADSPVPFDAYRRGGAEILLPILNFQGQDDVCESWIDVQNLGVDAAKVMLVTWGEPGFCPPQAAGPLKMECSGAVAPGASWTFSGAMVPTGSRGGELYRLHDALYTPPWPDAELIDDMTMADWICTSVFYSMLEDGDESPRFIRAYRSGALFEGIPFHDAAGSGQLAATVTRRCPGAATPRVDAISRYNGIALNRVGDDDPAQGGYVVFAPDANVAGNFDGGKTVLYVQNAGLQCASIDLWFMAHDACGRARLCDTKTLAPLETLHLDAADCGPPSAAGAMWVRATQPVAVVAERIVGDASATYPGVPSTLRAAFDPARAAPRPTGPVLSVPYATNRIGDDAAHVAVVNTHPAASARIRLTLLDPSGAVRTSFTDWLCPRGGASYDLTAIGDLPAGWNGAARIVALDGGMPPGDDLALAGGVPTSGLIALPSVQRAADGGATTIVVHNGAVTPGFTALSTDVFDANGHVDADCARLVAGAQLAIDLDSLGYLGPGFRGAAVISAWSWSHGTREGRAFHPAGPLLNAAELAVQAIDGATRSKARVGQAGIIVAGIPVQRRDVVDVPGAAWLGLEPPSCALPLGKPGPASPSQP